MTDKKTPNLKALEPDLEREIQAFENSAIRIGEILAEIKDSGVWKTEANYSTFQGYYKARQLKRIEAPLKRAEFWEKLNQGEEPVTRKRVSEGIRKEKAVGIRKEKATGPVTAYGKPYDLDKWGRAAGSGRRSRASRSSSSTAT
jgi:hypothetical protein